LLTVYLGIVRLFLQQPIAGRPLLLLAILLTLVGVQFVTMGLLGELVVRTYHETQHKPIYMIREVVASESSAGPDTPDSTLPASAPDTSPEVRRTT